MDIEEDISNLIVECKLKQERYKLLIKSGNKAYNKLGDYDKYPEMFTDLEKTLNLIASQKISKDYEQYLVNEYFPSLIIDLLSAKIFGLIDNIYMIKIGRAHV